MLTSFLRRLAVSAVPALGIALLTQAAPVAAQGLRAGMAVADLHGPAGFESRNGLVLGAAFNFLRIGPVEVVPEILYAQLGGNLSTPSEQTIEDIRIDYFQIPIMVRLGAPIPGAPFLRPSLSAGGYFSFVTKCSFGFADGSDRSELCTFNGLQDVGIDGAFRDTDFGWIAGAAVEISTGTIGNIAFDVRYLGSIRSITVEGSVDDVKNRAWLLLVGWSPDLR